MKSIKDYVNTWLILQFVFYRKGLGVVVREVFVGKNTWVRTRMTQVPVRRLRHMGCELGAEILHGDPGDRLGKMLGYFTKIPLASVCIMDWSREEL